MPGNRPLIPKLGIAFAGLIALFSALEPFLVRGNFGVLTDRIAFVAMGVIGAFFVVYYAIKGRMYRKADMWLFLALFVYALAVTWGLYGFSKSLFTVRFYYMWMLFVFCFIAARVAQDPEAVIRAFSFVYVAVICGLGLFILVHATLTLQQAIPDSDRMLGCFRVGRLCGLSNANTMSFHCLTCLMLAIYRCIKGGQGTRIFYGIAIGILWFLMGLNNCRTTVFAFAFTVAAFLFAMLRKHFTKKGAKAFKKYVLSIAAGVVAAVAVVVLFMLPTLIYRAGVTAAAKLTHDRQMLDNVALVYERNVADTDTLEDRSMLWNRSLELICKNPRRALFGISVRSVEGLNAYEGRHDIIMTFAHNMFLEVFRKLGLIGLLIWIALLIIWGKRAVSIMLDIDRDSGTVYLMCVAAGVLLTGATELGPFPFSVATAVPYLFFLCCGTAMRDDDNGKETCKEKAAA